jgi:hypothetical protein
MDWDFNGGLYDTTGNGLAPYAYIGDGLPGDTTGGITNVDYAGGDATACPYRGPNGMHQEVTSDIPLPGYSVGEDYDIGNFNSGQWANYTRSYPAGNYLVYGRLAGYAMNTALSQVTAGWGTTTQTLKQLGTWVANPGGWQSWTWVPLQNNGAPVILSLAGTNTLRVTSGGNCNANYFMLLPVQGINISAVKSGNNTAVSFPTKAGVSYSVYSTTSLIGGTWSLVATVPGNGSVKLVNDPISGGSRYYKVTSP